MQRAGVGDYREVWGQPGISSQIDFQWDLVSFLKFVFGATVAGSQYQSGL